MSSLVNQFLKYGISPVKTFKNLTLVEYVKTSENLTLAEYIFVKLR